MLSGTYIYGMDRKGRVIMPAPFRQELGVPFVLTRAPGQSLLAFSTSQWQELNERYHRSALFRGYYRSAAVECGVEQTNGRFLIPHVLREYAELRPMEQIAVTGIGRAVQVVKRERWADSVRQAEFLTLGQMDLDLDVPRPVEPENYRQRVGRPCGLPIVEARGRMDARSTRRLARTLLDLIAEKPQALFLDVRGAREMETSLPQLLGLLGPALSNGSTRLCLVGSCLARLTDPVRCFPDFESALWFLASG